MWQKLKRFCSENWKQILTYIGAILIAAWNHEGILLNNWNLILGIIILLIVSGWLIWDKAIRRYIEVNKNLKQVGNEVKEFREEFSKKLGRLNETLNDFEDLVIRGSKDMDSLVDIHKQTGELLSDCREFIDKSFSECREVLESVERLKNDKF